MLNFDFTGKVVVVTGGSRGIGKGIAQAFAEAGAKVALTFQSNDEAAEKTLAQLPGAGHKMYKFNAAIQTEVEEAIPRIHSEMGGLHILVNNAGVTRDKLLLMMKAEDWDQVIATNLRSVFLCTKMAVKLMLKTREGSIINITSVVGQMGQGGQSNYAASKAGIIAFTKSVAQEVASRQIRLNCIAPGFIQTDMTDSLTEEQKKAFMDAIPLKSMGLATDVAYGCLYLASPFARYVTGHTLNINGGLYM